MIFCKDPAEKEKKGRKEGERKGEEKKGKEERREKQVILWYYYKYPREISGTPKSSWTTFLRTTALQAGIRHSPSSQVAESKDNRIFMPEAQCLEKYRSSSEVGFTREDCLGRWAS